MKISYDNVWAYVEDASDAEHKWLQEYLVVPNANFKAVLRGNANVSIYVSERFPAGLIPVVKKAAKKEGLPFKTTDKRAAGAPVSLESVDEWDWPRDYQTEAALRALVKERGIIKIPGGGGKSECAVLIAWAVHGLCLFVCHSSELARQMHERWRHYTSTRAGLIVGRKGQPPIWDVHGEDRIICATYSQLLARLKARDPRLKKLLPCVVALLVDECHSAAASLHDVILQKLANARVRIGFSATPVDRLDRRNTVTIGALGPIIYSKANEELVARKIVAQGHVRFVRCDQTSDKITLAGVRRELIVRSRIRNRLAVEIVKVAKRPVIVFVKIIKHGHLLEKMLLKAGLRTRFVWGTHSAEYRKTARDDLVKDRLDVVIANKIWHEGINIRELASVVNLASGKSLIEVLQRVLRGSRVIDGVKYEFDIWDIWDSGQKWLERHSRAREKAYASVGYTIKHLQGTP